MPVRWIFGILVLTATSPARAQPQLVFQVQPGTIPNLAPVMAHEARCAALSESLGLLAFGHGTKNSDGHISLVKLDEKGIPSPSAIRWHLPRPEALEDSGTHVTSLVFHPRLPLLYVWQEANVVVSPKEAPGIWDMDHLHIFDVSKAPPERVLSFYRGREFLYGQNAGALAIAPDGSYLFVPNLHEEKAGNFRRVGRTPLDADGFPVVLDQDLPRAERIQALEKMNREGKTSPKERTPMDITGVFLNNLFGSIMSQQALGPDVMIGGGWHGVMIWRPSDKSAPLQSVTLAGHRATFIDVHPTLPAVLATKFQDRSLFHLEQVEGYLTTLPTQGRFTDANLTSPPAILTKTNQVAVGGKYELFLVNLDRDGRLTPQAIRMPIFNAGVRALVYSPKFDRLYVSLDLSR